VSRKRVESITLKLDDPHLIPTSGGPQWLLGLAVAAAHALGRPLLDVLDKAQRLGEELSEDR
jgi:hypothetical protein